MKVIYVITKSAWGGAQKYVFDLATSLPRDQFEAIVVFGGNGPLAEKLSVAGIRTISLPSLQRDVNIWNDAKILFALMKIFRQEKPDIVHVNSSKTGGLGAVAARWTSKARVVFTCHGWPFNEDRGAISLALIKFFSWLTVMFTHITIAVSERDTHDGKYLPWAKNKVVLVHNGIREPKFLDRTTARAFITESARTKGVNIGEKDFLIGAIGELHRNKGYEYLLPAIKKLDTASKLVIISDGEERAKLEWTIAKLGIQKRVAMLGFIKDAPTYLKAFDAFILSSLKEGLPYVVIEAGFAKLPVVATNVGGVKEIIEDMKSGILIQTKKIDDIAQGLQLLKNEPEKARLFSANLHKKVVADFSLGEMVRKTIGVYTDSSSK
jgi:glycosyltransferase involved in cell wall biosynthesis